MFRVRPASAAITLMHSRFASREISRSDCQIESIPPLSQMSTHFQKPRASSEGEVGYADAGADGHGFSKRCRRSLTRRAQRSRGMAVALVGGPANMPRP